MELEIILLHTVWQYDTVNTFFTLTYLVSLETETLFKPGYKTCLGWLNLKWTHEKHTHHSHLSIYNHFQVSSRPPCPEFILVDTKVAALSQFGFIIYNGMKLDGYHTMCIYLLAKYARKWRISPCQIQQWVPGALYICKVRNWFISIPFVDDSVT